MTLAEQSTHDRLYWQAFALLEADFRRAFMRGPTALVNTPHDKEGAQAQVVEVVMNLLQGEVNITTTDCGLLEVIARAASGDSMQAPAQDVIDAMARAFATHYTEAMDDAGDLHE